MIMCIAWKNTVAEVNLNHNIEEQKKVQSVNMDFMYFDFDMDFRYLDLKNIKRFSLVIQGHLWNFTPQTSHTFMDNLM